MKKNMKILLMCFTLISVASISGFAYSCTVNGNGSQITHVDTGNKNDKGNDSNTIIDNKDDTNQLGNIDVSKESVQYEGLRIDKENYHLIEPVLKKLNFNNKIVLHEITNEMINNALHSNEEFKDLNAQILNSSNTREGKLDLKLFGSYKGEKIDSNISILGFVDKDYFKNIRIGNYQLNWYNWFNDLLPVEYELHLPNGYYFINQIESIPWDKFNQYIENADIYKGSTDEVILSLKEANKLGLVVGFGAKVDSNRSSMKINIKNIKYKSYKFVDTKWVENSQSDDIQFDISNNLNTIYLSNRIELLSIILKNTKINDDVLKKYYPSYFSAQAMYSKKIGIDANNKDGIPFPKIKDLIIPPMEFLKKVSHRYFGFSEGSHLGININSDHVIADDIKGELEIKLIIYERSFGNPLQPTQTIIKRGVNKNLSNLLKEYKINNVFLKKDEFSQNKGLAYQLAKKIKETYPNIINNQVNNNSNNPSKRLDLSMFNQLKVTPIYSNNRNVFNPNNNFMKGIEHKIFNIPINVVDMGGAGGAFIKGPWKQGDIERHSGLFIYNENELFQINEISYDMPLLVNNLKVQNKGPNNYVFSFEFLTSIKLQGDSIKQKSIMNLELSKNEWDSLK